MMMYPAYDQQSTCYYYSNPTPPPLPCQQFPQFSPPSIVSSSQVENPFN